MSLSAFYDIGLNESASCLLSTCCVSVGSDVVDCVTATETFSAVKQTHIFLTWLCQQSMSTGLLLQGLKWYIFPCILYIMDEKLWHIFEKHMQHVWGITVPKNVHYSLGT